MEHAKLLRELLEALSCKELCYKNVIKGVDTYAFDLSTATSEWWLIFYLRKDYRLHVSLFDGKRYRTLSLKGIDVREGNTLLLQFKGLQIPVRVC